MFTALALSCWTLWLAMDVAQMRTITEATILQHSQFPLLYTALQTPRAHRVTRTPSDMKLSSVLAMVTGPAEGAQRLATPALIWRRDGVRGLHWEAPSALAETTAETACVAGVAGVAGAEGPSGPPDTAVVLESVSPSSSSQSRFPHPGCPWRSHPLWPPLLATEPMWVCRTAGRVAAWQLLITRTQEDTSNLG